MSVLSFLIFFPFSAVICLFAVKKGINWWIWRNEEHKKEVFKMVEAIIDVLQTHSHNCGDRETFLALDHVRDQLIPPHQRLSEYFRTLFHYIS